MQKIDKPWKWVYRNNYVTSKKKVESMTEFKDAYVPKDNRFKGYEDVLVHHMKVNGDEF